MIPESVTDVIVSRSRPLEPMRTMLAWSTAGHVVVFALLLAWSVRPATDSSEPVMTISLGGAPGPQSGGLTQLGARAVQAVPIEAPARPVATPPTPTPPTMTLPDERARPRRPPPPAKPAPSPRAEASGAEPTQGTARADTGVVRGQGFGLSSAGGGGGPVQLDVADFCCPDYLAQMVTLVQRGWDQNQGIVGSTTVKFTILRDGTIQGLQVEQPSGFLALDRAATRAMQLVQLPPLPVAYTNPTLGVHLRFDYQR